MDTQVKASAVSDNASSLRVRDSAVPDNSSFLQLKDSAVSSGDSTASLLRKQESRIQFLKDNSLWFISL